MAVWFDHADSFELDHFDQYFHLIFWLKVNNDTVLEATVLVYARYEPSINYVNHVLLVFESYYGNIQKCF